MPTLFDQITSKDNFANAYHKIMLAQGKYKPEALIFSRNETVNLERLRQEVLRGEYKPRGYHSFYVYEPKERLIHAPAFRDKIVQRAIQVVLNDFYLPKFIRENYACLPGRGVHEAVDKVQANLRIAQHKYKEPYILKLDVRKYFYSIDREILKRIYRSKIKEPRTLALLDAIVDSAKIVGDKGLPLGNATSQTFANLYLDRLDQACKRYWGYKLYVRYMDDVIIVLPDKDAAREALTRCTYFLRDRLNLVANPKKTKIFPLAQGVNAFGYKIWTTHRLLRDNSKRKMKRKIKAFPHLIEEGRLTEEKANQMLASWQGHAQHGNSENFIRSLESRYPYIKRDKGKLKLDTSKL